jgi:transforming growth factor-beta-induced protein
VFGPSSVGEATPETEGLDTILKYHIVGTKLNAANLRDGARLMTLAGATVKVGVPSEGAISVTDLNCNTVDVSSADINASNGILHVVSGLLSPPAMTTADYLGGGDIALQDITEALQGVGGFFTVLQAASDTGLDGTLASSGQRTLFVPNEGAFAGLELTAINADVLANILLYHVVPGYTTSCELTDGGLATLAGVPAVVDTAAGTVGGAALGSRVDIEANNGVAHELDALMIPPTILEVAGANENLSDLVAAVQTSSAVQDALNPNTLGGDSPITVFAPTNEALQAAGTPADLVAVLQHHIVPSQLLADAFSGLEAGEDDDVVVSTLNGDLTFTAREETVDDETVSVVYLIDGAGNEYKIDDLFATTDIRTLSGAVHVINNVLLP